MNETLRLLGIFAHPDDEIGVGGTLARYAQNGNDVTLICATRGEAATIFCEDCATPETLAQVRTRELECCCRELGIRQLLWLDWPDGAVASIPMEEAVAQLVPHLRRLRPHILITHPEHGSYPHPDHIAVHERVVAAFHAAADEAYRPEFGPAWPIPKLYVRAIPEAVFDMIPGFRDYRVHLNGQALPFRADPDESIDCTVDCRESVERRIAAWKCHRSQHNPNGTFSTMPEEMQRRIFAHEHFRLLAHHLDHDLAPHHDLAAGLNSRHG
ncbi:MAG: hypothetical protein D6775_16580 [Caldilineae bacterium]|nr:MAG: hypothetical protein D6775_16580 [Caldilineae bacterium]